MENYEQKYKEAIERASHIKDNNTVATPQEVAEFLFPELKESEDGKIRKEIIEYITRYKDCITDKEYDSWIDWLEKKGEQKHAWSEEDELMIKDAIHWINEFQKSNRCKDENDMQNSVTCENWLKSLIDKVQPQQKQEWSEEKLTEFEKEVKDLMNSCCNEIGEMIVTDEWAKDTASTLLDLARKELQP